MTEVATITNTPYSASAISSWLQQARQSLLQLASGADKTSPTRLVLCVGNEASDCDSMVCALTYAYHQAHVSAVNAASAATPSAEHTLYLPCWQLNRDDIALRPEVPYLLQTLGLSTISSHVLCLEDMPMIASIVTLQVAQVSLILLDHNANTLSIAPQITSVPVDAIIDHHQDVKKHEQAQPRIIEMVGSCSTLIWQRILADNLLPEQISSSIESSNSSDHVTSLISSCSPIPMLIAATILLDTSNLTLKATEADIHAINHTLATACSFLTSPDDRQQVFARLLSLRSDVSSLTIPQLLRKDVKFGNVVSSVGLETRYAISTVPMPVYEFVQQAVRFASSSSSSSDPSLSPFLQEAIIFLRSRQLHALGIMTAFSDAQKKFQRQLVWVFDQTACASVADDIHAYWLNHTDLQLIPLESSTWSALTHSPCSADSLSRHDISSHVIIMGWSQSNLQASRKQVIPFTDICFERHAAAAHHSSFAPKL